MQKPHKIKAFTLSELVVVIVITAIVVGLAFSVLQLTQKQLKAVADKYAETTQLQLLEQSLWADFHRYQTVTYHPEKEQLSFRHALDSVVYSFEKDRIIKVQDTFFLSVTHKLFYREGALTPGGVLDAIQLQTSAENQHKKLFIFKQNDATHLINSWHSN